MSSLISDILFSPSVKRFQELFGSRKGYANMERRGGWSNVISEDLAAFIATRTSFYLGTASAEGQPYIQHRGGPPGFLKVLDERTLAFADFSGNKQFISMGNLAENDRAYLFLMDYSARRRVKIWGRASFIQDNAELLEALSDPNYPAKVQRVLRFSLEAWDVNCPQHIPRLYTEEEIAERESDLRRQLAQALARNSE